MWKLEISCPEALSINLLYNKFWLPEGGKFFIYNADKTETIGAFTSFNNKGNRKDPQGFATALVFGNKSILEYYPPNNNISEAAIISIEYVVQGYRNIFRKQSQKDADYLQDYGQSYECQVNINCSPEGDNWQLEKEAVALLQLTENPANLRNINFYYLGWDRNVNFSNSCIDIHHPNGDVKKISYCSNNFETTDLYSYDYNFNGAYWKTTFISTLNGFGVIEGGSSGSPLINGNRKLIAQLRGGGVTCLLNMKPVWYGRLSVSWTGANNPDIRRRLDHWLDPNNLGTQILDGIFKCNETIVNKIVNSNETIKCDKINILNTTIQNNSKLTLQANEVIFYPCFEVKGGSELEIK